MHPRKTKPEDRVLLNEADFAFSFQIREDFDKLVGLIDGKLSPEEQQSLEELHLYMLEDEGSWALGDGFLSFIGTHRPSVLSDAKSNLARMRCHP